MKFCGVDVAARRGSHLCLLTEDDPGLLNATFYESGTLEPLERTIAKLRPAALAIDAPARPRLNLLAGNGSVRAKLPELPRGRYERFRVCDALLVRRGLFLYSVPSKEEETPEWMRTGFELFGRMERRAFRPFAPAKPPPFEGRVPRGARRRAKLIETFPDAGFCVLLGRRPASKKTPAGLADRISCLEDQGVIDDGDLPRRDVDELDACVAALTARAFALGEATWLGHAEEGVMVLPAPEILPTYRRDSSLEPARVPLERA